jgi:DNA-binding NtrC family response regulator
MSQRILIADDQTDVQTAFRLLLKPQGYAVTTVSSPQEVLKQIAEREFDLLLMDLNYALDTTSGEEGLQLLGDLQKATPELPVVVMTAWGTVEIAVEAMRRGAKDFITKPWENERVLAIIKTQVMLAEALKQGSRLAAENQLLKGVKRPTMIAASAAMQPVLKLISRVGPSDANVLITGEPGTGKEVVAQTLHAMSNRADKPLISVNMGGLAEGVFDSELFGHVKGAFTDAKTDRMGRFELASEGTLFLDEIANLPFNLQAKLLRVLEVGEMERVGSSRTIRVNARVLSATNANITEAVQQGRFRDDLLFRLNTIEVQLPPLRERQEDIPLLAAHYLAIYSRKYNKQIVGIETAALNTLKSYPWPGNIRELSHTLERAVLMSEGNQIRAADLSLRPTVTMASRLEEMSLEDAESLLVQKAMAKFDGNVSKAAEALGLSRGALYRRLQRHEV